MLVNEFPDIHWLRKVAKTDFENRQGIHNVQLPVKGWPNIALNVKSNGAERRDIKGPFSLFLNITGNSIVEADNQSVTVNPDT